MNIEIYICIWDIEALYNGRHFADDIFKRISFISEFNEIIQWSILAIIQHRIRWWLGAKQATSHYLTKWSPRLLIHECGIRPQWINYFQTKNDRTYYVLDINIRLTLCCLSELTVIIKTVFLRVARLKIQTKTKTQIKTTLCWSSTVKHTDMLIDLFVCFVGKSYGLFVIMWFFCS